MNDQITYKHIAAISAFISGAVQFATVAISISAVGVNVDLLAEPVNMILLDARGTEMFRWAWMLSIFGYYLLLIPVAVYLQAWFQPRNEGLARTTTSFAMVYFIVGTISIAIMVGAALPMMQAYSAASAPQNEIMLVVFQAVTDMSFFGMGPLAFAAGGLWWLGVGIALLKEQRILSIITLVLGIGTLGSAIGYFLGIDLLARLEMVNYFLAPIWSLWIGISITRHTEKGKFSLETAPVA